MSEKMRDYGKDLPSFSDREAILIRAMQTGTVLPPDTQEQKTLLPEWALEIRERADKATPGPWEVRKVYPLDGRGVIYSGKGEENKSIAYVPEVWERWHESKDHDFILHSRTDIPRLLQALEAEIRKVERAKTTLKRVYGKLIPPNREHMAITESVLLISKALKELEE